MSADLRSSAQDYKRAAARKHKWAFGEQETSGRGEGNPRPRRVSENPHCAARRRNIWHETYSARKARKHVLVLGSASTDSTDEDDNVSTSSGNTSSSDNDTAAAVTDSVLAPSPSAPLSADAAAVMYSFDAARGPSAGSQILNVALARAVERFEEKETVKLVRTEYDVLDSEGETVAAARAQGKGGKLPGAAAQKLPPVSLVRSNEDEEYEFV